MFYIATMQVNSPISPNFKSRNIDIRNANAIANHVNRCFPMFKPTYALQYWKIFDTAKENGAQLKTHFSRKYMGKVMAIRDEYLGEYTQKPYHIELTDSVKSSKLGNCFESAFITLETLYANGFEKSKKVSPRLEITGYDKSTKKEVIWKSFSIDHTCVITSMNNPKRVDIDDVIVIDSWLNKAMTVPEAKQEFFKLISKKELARNLFETQHELKKKLNNFSDNKGFDLNNYEFKTNIHFVSDENFVSSEIKEISQDVRERYPQLIIDYLA